MSDAPMKHISPDTMDDAPKLDAAFFAGARVRVGGKVVREGAGASSRRGRPPKGNAPKVQQSLRLSPEVLAFFRQSGEGWQSRIDDVLLNYVRSQASATSPDQGEPRARSFAGTISVQDPVHLREEHVKVERSPVEHRLTDTKHTFREHENPIIETAEEAVVGKIARVVEEVVVRKEAFERTESIDDTVRRTEIDIDRSNYDSADLDRR